MFVSFFESLRYVGHLLPIAFLRIYVGVYFLSEAFEHLSGNFLLLPELASSLSGWLLKVELPHWYLNILENIFLPNWQLFAYLITVIKLVIGVSFIFGFLVSPLSPCGHRLKPFLLANSSQPYF